MKLIYILLGPEVFWLGLYFASSFAAKFNTPPTPAGNNLLERGCTAGVFFATALTFLFLLMPVENKWAVLVRIGFAVFAGANLCLFRLVGAIDYGDSRNSGTFGFWVFGLMVGGATLLVGFVVSAILLRRSILQGV